MNAASSLLAPLLPPADHTTLLRACLCGGAETAAAWEAWRAAGGDLASTLRVEPGLRSLSPLLDRALGTAPTEVDRPTLTLLRTASTREELRSAAFERVTADVLGAVTEAGVVPIVTGDTALATSVYPRAALRHRHDLDLLLAEDELGVTATALAAASVERSRSPDGSTIALRHHSGVDINLRTHLLAESYYEPSLQSIGARAAPLPIAGVGVRTLSPSDMLVHVCAYAARHTRRRSIMWAPDAWFTSSRWSDLNWSELVHTALASRIELLMSATLSYVANELGAPIPVSVLANLDEAAAVGDTVGRQVAFDLAWQARREEGRRRHLPTRSPRAMLTWTRWALLPAPGYLLATGRARRRASLPISYLVRPLRQVVRPLARRTRWTG